MNAPKRPLLHIRSLPQEGHFSSIGASFSTCSRPPSPRIRRLVDLHSGYLLHARKGPKRPFLSTIGCPSFGQTSLATSSCTSGESAPSPPAIWRVFLHSG